jgi:hypothetical protein
VSHIVQVQTEIRDATAIKSACRRLQLPEPVFGEVKLFRETKTGWAVRLPDWQYPVVCSTETGQINYDNFRGHWGDQKHLNLFLQRYSVEKAKIEGLKRGHSVTEQQREDGSIKVVVQVGGSE